MLPFIDKGCSFAQTIGQLLIFNDFVPLFVNQIKTPMKNSIKYINTAMSRIFAAVTVLCFCTTGNAQLDYSGSLAGSTLILSNYFGGGHVDINGTAPTYINPNATSYGASLSAAFDVVTNNPALGYAVYQDGTFSNLLDSVLLPFSPKAGYVYTFSSELTFQVIPPAGGWGGLGFATHFPASNASTSDPRMGSSYVGGNPWALLNMFANAGGAALEASGAQQGSVGNLMTALNTPYTVNLVLDTTSSKWVAALYVNGSYVKEYTYSSNPSLLSFGYTQTTTAGGAFQWGPLTLSASPLVITKQPVSASVGAGISFTNTVQVAAVSPSYQWYTNGVPIADATNASLILNSVTTADTGTNYYVVVTNSLGGSVTSSVASLTVYAAPVFSSAYPVNYTNLMTLYGGTNMNGTNYPGSSPSFAVSAIGESPLYYQWQTNGVDVAGATNVNFTFQDCQYDAPTNFSCVVTNSNGAVTNTWLAEYLPTPFAAFPSTVLSYDPIGFWRLNESPDDGSGDAGLICNDYQGGNNGIYTNAYIGQPGYTNTDPTDGSVRFNYYSYPYSDTYGIQGIDFSTSSKAAFSVQAWANGTTGAQPNGSCILAKGYSGGEQFALDVNGGKYRFLVRNAAGSAYSVTASTGPDGNWEFLVGVCDEVHGTLSLYVNGLVVATASIPVGSGMFYNDSPVQIGARGASSGDDGSLGFYGYLSDLAVYNQPLSSGQIANLWIAAGYSVGFSFVPPLPPTNYVFLTGGTLSIPATVFGPTPAGYYWTNLTTGTIMASGSTNNFGSLDIGNLDATLAISNAPASLSGDQLELVVTNATSSTNAFVTLFSPAPPVELDYTSPILYSNYFDGGTWSLNGMPLTAENVLVGGTNTTWDVVSNNPAGGYAAYGNGTLGPDLNSVLLPFMPHSGYVYTLDASLTFLVTPPAGGWGGLGFGSHLPPSNSGVPDPRMGSAYIGGNPWALLNMFANGGGAILNANGANKGQKGNLMTALNTPYDIQLTLDTTGSNWVTALSIDNTSVASYTYPSNPSLQSFGYTQTTTTGGAFEWNYISLTQVAPGGVPPYLLNTVPTNSILLTNGTVTIPATVFGSAPLGYYWINNSTVLTSGTTNNMAPLPADLSISSASLSAGQLNLVLTNAYGTNITSIALVSPINPNPTNIVFAVNGSQVALSWPLDHTGWTLQSQTNPLTIGITTNWYNVSGSTLTNQMTLPIDSGNASVFYRLFYK